MAETSLPNNPWLPISFAVGLIALFGWLFINVTFGFLVLFVVVISLVLLWLDATEIKPSAMKVDRGFDPATYLVLAIFIWIVGFPYYLYKRGQIDSRLRVPR